MSPAAACGRVTPMPEPAYTEGIRYDGDTYRAAYTVQFAEVVYVLHAFQKKSRKGIETPKADMDLIRTRLARARKDYQEWRKNQTSR